MIIRRISYGTSIECSVFVGIQKTGLAVCFLMEGIVVIVMQKASCSVINIISLKLKKNLIYICIYVCVFNVCVCVCVCVYIYMYIYIYI